MYAERVSILTYRLKNLDATLAMPLKNSNQVLALVARDSRIYAFQRCVYAFRGVLLDLYHVTKAGKGPLIVEEALQEVEELDRLAGDEEEMFHDQTMLIVFHALGALTIADAENLSSWLYSTELFELPSELEFVDDKELFVAEREECFMAIPRFYSLVNRLLPGLVRLSRSFHEME